MFALWGFNIMTSISNSQAFTSTLNQTGAITAVTVTGTGTVVAARFCNANQKMYSITAAALNGTASYTWASNFTRTPAYVISAGSTLSVTGISTASIQISGTTSSGTIFVMGGQ